MSCVRDVTAQVPRGDVVASSPPAAPHRPRRPRRRRAVALGALLGTAAARGAIRARRAVGTRRRAARAGDLRP